MKLSILFLIGIIAGLLSVWGAVKLFPRLNLLDFPERYGLQRKKIPYPGGVILALLAILTCVCFGWYGIAGAIGITTVISFLDDRYQIPASIRLLVQICVAGSIALILGISITQIGNPFGEGAFLFSTTVATFLTIAWLILVQNALNWFDGLKGLCVGISGIGFIILGIFGLIRPEVAWEADLPVFLNVTFSLAGVCIGAWMLFFRGKILLGDTGSQVLGLLLGVLSIIAGTKLATTLLLLGLPLLDAVAIILRRIFIDKKSPLHGDQRHIHHALAKKMGEKKAVLLLLLISAILGTGSLFLPGWGKLTLVTILGIFLLWIHFQKKTYTA